MTTYKQCKLCLRNLDHSKFHVYKLSHDGLSRYCKDCTLFGQRKTTMKRYATNIVPREGQLPMDPRLNHHNAQMIRLASIRFPTTMECYDVFTGQIGTAHFYEGGGLNINFPQANRGFSWVFSGPLSSDTVIEFFCTVLKENHIRLESDSLARYESMTQVYGFRFDDPK